MSIRTTRPSGTPHVVSSFVNFLLCSTKRNFVENCIRIVPCLSLNQCRHSINICMWDNKFRTNFPHISYKELFFPPYFRKAVHTINFLLYCEQSCSSRVCVAFVGWCFGFLIPFLFLNSNAFRKHWQSVIYCSYLTLPRTSDLSMATIYTILLYCNTLWKEPVAGSSVRKHRMSLCSG